MTAATNAGGKVAPAPRKRRIKRRRVVLHLFLITMALFWIFPLLWAFYTSLRPLADTIKNGYLSWPTTLSFQNYIDGFTNANLGYYYLNTMIVAVPAVILVLLVSSMVAFALSRVRSRINVFFLLMFTAGNLLPPQVIIVPLYYMYLAIPIPHPLSDNGLLYDQYIGIILIHVVFQVGFCIFVLSNYMRTLPRELNEAALVDGASVFRTYRSVILPLCAPALAALGTLEFTFIYNDFFWALVLMVTGSKRPITSALNNLKGAYFTDTNVLAAAALMVAIPTILVFVLFQRQFIRGLTLGSTKG
jgi:multiple sugar transport system permease protein